MPRGLLSRFRHVALENGAYGRFKLTVRFLFPQEAPIAQHQHKLPDLRFELGSVLKTCHGFLEATEHRNPNHTKQHRSPVLVARHHTLLIPLAFLPIESTEKKK